MALDRSGKGTEETTEVIEDPGRGWREDLLFTVQGQVFPLPATNCKGGADKILLLLAT